jgi:uncharacterized LabA/DUF88 family protein
MRTFVYIDGFNLYYGALKDTPYKWLDPKALFKQILRPQNHILAIKYYIARVSARPDDPGAPARQDVYLRALEAHISELTITEGHFIQKAVSMPLAKPTWRQKYARVIKTEEKGSDVNLAVHLVHDGWRNKYDCAVVCSNDGDLSEALRIVKRELHKAVVLVVPGDPSIRTPSVALKRWASKTIQISKEILALSQLPNPIPGTTINKPVAWK